MLLIVLCFNGARLPTCVSCLHFAVDRYPRRSNSVLFLTTFILHSLFFLALVIRANYQDSVVILLSGSRSWCSIDPLSLSCSLLVSLTLCHLSLRLSWVCHAPSPRPSSSTFAPLLQSFSLCFTYHIGREWDMIECHSGVYLVVS